MNLKPVYALAWYTAGVITGLIIAEIIFKLTMGFIP